MSLNVQNATLYVFGLTINGLLYLFQDGIKKGKFRDVKPSKARLTCSNGRVVIGFFKLFFVIGSLGLFQGFSTYTWILVLTQSVAGIFMGFVMKYANNIVRIFIIASAMIVTTLASVVIFGLVLKASFLLSASLIISAVVLYNYWVEILFYIYAVFCFYKSSFKRKQVQFLVFSRWFLIIMIHGISVE